MSAVIVNIEFTEMKKNKKESLKFTLKGSDEKEIGKQLYDMAGSIVHMEIKGCAVGKFPAEFVDIKKSAKGVVANFLLKGDLSDEKSGQIYAYSGGNNVELTLEESQMSIEDFHDDEHEGVPYSVGKDGTVDVDADQLDMEAVIKDQEQPESELEARARRKREKEAKAVETKQTIASDDDLPM